MNSLGTNRFFVGIWTSKVEDHEAKLDLCQKDWGIRGYRILGDFCLKGKSKRKKLDMFDVITHRCRGTSLVSCEDYLKEVPLFLICCIRADQDMQEHQQSRDKLQQSTSQAWRQLFWCASTFMKIHDSTCFMNSPCWSLHLQGVPDMYTSFSLFSKSRSWHFTWRLLVRVNWGRVASVAGLVSPGGERVGRCSLVLASEGFRSFQSIISISTATLWRKTTWFIP